MTYANWLGRQMTERRFTQRQLAFRAGVDHGTVSRTLAGSMPTVRTLSRLSRIVGWPPIDTLDPPTPAGMQPPAIVTALAARNDRPAA